MKNIIKYFIESYKRIFRYCDQEHCYNKMKHHLLQINEDGTRTDIYYCAECSEHLLKIKKVYNTTPKMRDLYNKLYSTNEKETYTYDDFKKEHSIEEIYVPMIYYIEEM